MREAMEIEHELLPVDEFEALFVEVKVRTSSASSSLAPLSSAEKAKPFIQPLARPRPGKYPAKLHARKVAKELKVQNGLIFLPGQQTLLHEDSDMNPEFRQRRYFYYLSGADFPGCSVTYDLARDSLILWIPQVDPKDVLWYGSLPSIEDCKKRSDVDDVRPIKALERYLHSSLVPGSTLYVLHSDQVPFLETTRGVLKIDALQLGEAMDKARVVKSDYELAMIRRACDISAAAHRAVLSRLKALNNERQVDAIFRGYCLAHGAKHQAYPVIAGAGVNASTLHYWQNDASLSGKQLICIDAGAEWECYASDITRTFPLSGAFTPEAAAIYRIVQRMQDECIARMRPGVIPAALQLLAFRIAAEELLALGILQNGTVEDIVSRGTVAAFFPHGLGHHVGLEVHDVSARPRKPKLLDVRKPHVRGAAGKRDWISAETLATMYREEAAGYSGNVGDKGGLSKNMVYTIEPGVYFCEPYIKAYYLSYPVHAKYINAAALAKYYPVGGCRIEDDILITDGSYEVLSSAAPKGEEALRIINGQ